MKKIFKNTEIFFQKNNKTMESGKITTRIIKGIYTALYSIGILLLFIGYNFRDSPPPSGWYLQTMPNLNGKSISDVFFLDSLTGWAVTGTNSGPGNINYILKTTNGGDNWLIKYDDTCFFSRIYFADTNNGYASGGSGGGRAYFYKTTNSGINWNRIWNTGASEFDDMSGLNKDTIWVVDHDRLTGGVFRTTNGGQSWTQQLSAGSQNPDKIYMYNARIGFIVNNNWGAKSLRKTTDSGNSWFNILNEGFSDMKFLDSLTGWKCWRADTINKTTNGGLNWINYLLPPTSGNFGSSVITQIAIINNDTIWGAGPEKYHTPNGSSGMLYITTNGGLNWGYQLPDISIYRYYLIDFESKKIGWAYSFFSGVHTVTGGDTTIYVGVNKKSNEIPSGYYLFQNYPNPFNQFTIINYKCSIAGEISLKVFDILGKEVRTLVNEKKQPGTYQLRFDAEGLPSGVYFYSLIIDGKNIDTKKLVLVK